MSEIIVYEDMSAVHSYKVTFDKDNHTLKFKGFLVKETPEEYDVLRSTLFDVVKQVTKFLIIDLKDVEKCNSSGLMVIFLFIIRLRDAKVCDKLLVEGSKKFGWQPGALENLGYIWTDISLKFSE